MAMTVVGIFDTLDHAQSAVAQLAAAGYDRDQISVLRGHPPERRAAMPTHGPRRRRRPHRRHARLGHGQRRGRRRRRHQSAIDADAETSPATT